MKQFCVMLIGSQANMRSIIQFAILIILITCVFRCSCSPSYGRKSRTQSQPNKDMMSKIEDRLEKVEEEVREKSKILDLEVVENSGRIMRLTDQNYDQETTLTNLQNEIYELANQTHENKVLEAKLSLFSKNLQNVLNSLETNSVEMKSLKERVEYMINSNIKKKVSNNFLSSYDSGYEHRSVRHINGKSSRVPDEKPRNCMDLKIEGKHSGVYKIFPENFPSGFLVLCEMESRGGGWTVVQNRYDGTQNFDLNFQDYRSGFGNLAGEFWLGLERIHHLTEHQVNELLVEMIDFTSTSKYAHYGSFSIGSEKEGFSLKLLGDYEGNAGDSLIYQAGSRFSTKDMDRDEWEEGNCAKSHGGAWWYKSCDTSNLNGKYLNGELPKNYKYTGMYWGGFRGAQYSLKQARIMVRPRDDAIRGDNERKLLKK